MTLNHKLSTVRRLCAAMLLGLLLPVAAMADTAAPDLGEQTRQRFDARYKNFFGADSQALLPFARLEAQDWKSLQQNRHLQQVFTEPDVFYNNKSYRITLYRADDGNYYLDAKGGFWGMDQLYYGPIDPGLLQPL